MGEGSLPAAEAEALIPQFVFERLLNQDQAGRRISLLGSIASKPALLVVERAPFANDVAHVSSLAQSLSKIKNLGNNDIYFWFMASSSTSATSTPVEDGAATKQPPDLKVNLIYPCTPKHVKKYSQQLLRMVSETPEVYRKYVRPYMERQRSDGRLDWMYNILEGRTEQDDVFFREPGPDGFLILPDLNWDRTTLLNLHVLALVERRDIWSLRDLSHAHVPWLKDMSAKILSATHKLYPDVERDQLKLYVHYQPTYYHFHVHVVHVMFEAGATQAVGKAFGLDNLIGQLEAMGEGKSMADVTLGYHLGEASELWTEVFGPLKEGKLP
ncbi:uncharacterized protein PV09_06753 [Verruconis gallopava]|uniref:Scavenger mRNA decapping enzyme n=1 Tax=Verruconis gallopava TaxID=253628 RepID=A0A0D1YM83_9PEZI|nr:uncharacterized protein PV09_06753 [Verruconis gallopava]KIW01912.1 hypothetical protein PV09_06753 [Verruconis gallopava]